MNVNEVIANRANKMLTRKKIMTVFTQIPMLTWTSQQMMLSQVQYTLHIINYLYLQKSLLP